MKREVHFIVVCNINLPQKHVCATFVIFKLLRVKLSSAAHTTYCCVSIATVVMRMLCYTYVAYLVFSSLLGQKGRLSEQGFSIFPEPACLQSI